MSREKLRVGVENGTIQDVVLAMPDLGGRLLGQRLDARHFLENVLPGDGMGACVYLLAVDVDMRTGPGYAIDAAALGYGDMLLRPSLPTMRPLPWDPGAVLVLADAVRQDGSTLDVAPRTVLRRQLDRAAARGWTPLAGVELEFLLFPGSYAEAHAHGYRGLRPGSRTNSDYALTGLEALDPVVRRIRTEMRTAGLRMESARGEVHRGQYEIVFRYAEAMDACDAAVFYKTGAKQIAAQEGAALTFLAKYDEGEGSSGHVHLSLRDAAGAVFADDTDPDGRSETMRHFVAGQLACLREFALLMAPHVNSWKRLAPGAFAPTAVAWGEDNRLCPVRVVGRGGALRFEHRVPGSDANPYLSVAAILAAGLHGVEHELPLGPPTAGPPGDNLPRLPASLAEALELWEGSAIAREAFGAEVVAHYAAAARAELRAFAGHVTDWELARGFERY